MGFKARARYREITCDWPLLAPDDESEPFKVTIQTNLTFDEIAAIPTIAPDVTFKEAQQSIAPYIVKWNAEGYLPESSDTVPLPTPAEAGSDVFDCIASGEDMQLITLWLVSQFRALPHGGPERKKTLTRSSATPEPLNAKSKSSQQARANSRRSQPITMS